MKVFVSIFIYSSVYPKSILIFKGVYIIKINKNFLIFGLKIYIFSVYLLIKSFFRNVFCCFFSFVSCSSFSLFSWSSTFSTLSEWGSVSGIYGFFGICSNHKWRYIDHVFTNSKKINNKNYLICLCLIIILAWWIDLAIPDFYTLV